MSNQDPVRGLGPLSDAMLSGLNQQISHEFGAEFAYLAMAGWFDNESLLGCSAFMEAQAAEERSHALRLYEYVLDRNGRVVIGPVGAARGDFSDAADAFRNALRNEEGVSESIKRLHQMAIDEGDSPTAVFLEWFLTEQVEEEKTFDDIVRRFELAGDNAAALLVLDIELGGKAGEGG